jgi:hypothetical protein
LVRAGGGDHLISSASVPFVLSSASEDRKE